MTIGARVAVAMVLALALTGCTTPTDEGSPPTPSTIVDALEELQSDGDTDAGLALELLAEDEGQTSAGDGLILRIDQRLVDAEDLADVDADPVGFIAAYEAARSEEGDPVDADFLTRNDQGNLEVADPLTDDQLDALAAWLADEDVLRLLYPAADL